MAAAPLLCFALETSATEADVIRQTWLRKVSDLQILPTDTGAHALFRCVLPLRDLRTKVSRWKSANAVERAQVHELAEDEWRAQLSRNRRSLLARHASNSHALVF